MAQDTQGQAVRAGVFVVLAAIAGLALLFALGPAAQWLNPTPTRYVRFPIEAGVAGLSPGDPVRLGGVKVGVVSGVSVSEHGGDEGGQQVVVAFELPGRFELRKDAGITVGGTLTGLAWLEITSLGKGAAATGDDAIVGKPGTFQVLLTQLGDLAPRIGVAVSNIDRETIPRLNAALDSGNTLAKRIDGHVDPIAKEVTDFTDAGTGAAAGVRDVLGDSAGDIRGTLSRLHGVTRTADEKLPGLVQRMDSLINEGETLAKTLNASSDDLSGMLGNARALSEDARSLVSRSRGRIERIMTSVDAAALDAKLAIGEVRRSPWRLLHKPADREEQLLDLYAAARQFADGAREVNEAAAALRDAATDPQVDEATLATLLQNLETQAAALGEAQGLFWERARAE